METGGDDRAALIERLAVSMESAIRLALLETLSATAARSAGSRIPVRSRFACVAVMHQVEQPQEGTTDYGCARPATAVRGPVRRSVPEYPTNRNLDPAVVRPRPVRLIDEQRTDHRAGDFATTVDVEAE